MFKIQVKNGSVRDYILKYSAKRQAWRKKYFLIEDGKDNLKKIQNDLYVHEGLPRVMNVKTYSKRIKNQNCSFLQFIKNCFFQNVRERNCSCSCLFVWA